MALSEQRKEYLYDYQKTKLKRIPLDVPKEKYEQIKAAADAAGEKVNGYIKKAVDERMERDNGQQAPASKPDKEYPPALYGQASHRPPLFLGCQKC